MSTPLVSLAEILLDIESGSRPKGGVDEFGDIPSLGAEHLDGNGGFNFKKIKRVSEDFFKKMRAGRIHTHDILVVKDGATTGKVALVRHDFHFEKAAVNEHLFILRVNPTIADPHYVFNFLNNENGKQLILKDFRGATVGGISKGFVDKILIPLPPIREQKRIASILDKAGQIKAMRQQAITKLDELASMIFEDCFIGNDYPCLSLSSICSLITDGTHYTPKDIKAGFPFLTVKDMTSEGLDFQNCSYISSDDFELVKSANCSPNIGDVLFSKDGTVGKVHVVTESTAFGILSSIAILRPDQQVVLPEFLGYALRSKAILSSALAKKTGAAIRRIILANLKNLLIPIPSLEMQTKFVDEIEVLKKTRMSCKQQLSNTNLLLRSLNHQAFTIGFK